VGEVISLAAHRNARVEDPYARSGVRNRVTFYFELASPYTYLAAERVDRLFGHVVWCPATSDALRDGDSAGDELARERERATAAQRAAALRLPLVWPENHPSPSRAAMRVAGLAAERGQGARFVLAATRLAFCGGFELDDPEVIAEAAAAALLDFDECLRAAGDASRDAEMDRTGRLLLAQGADRLPALRVGRSLYCGEARLGEAAAAWRATPLRVARAAPGA
jgi:2-hydroxychromene-2-carboxylate isomerase